MRMLHWNLNVSQEDHAVVADLLWAWNLQQDMDRSICNQPYFRSRFIMLSARRIRSCWNPSV